MNETLIDAMAQAESLLREFERGPNGDFAATPYLCPSGKKTIGWGHVIRPGEKFPYPITRDQADDLLQKDMLWMAEKVESMVTVPVTPAMLAALISFAFNVGIYALCKSTLLRFLNDGDYAGAAAQFDRWNKGTDFRTREKIILPGLTRRRETEKALFLQNGIPDETA